MMTGFLLDTHVVSELRKRDRCNTGVRTWIEAIDSGQLYLRVLVLGELCQGIELIHRRDKVSA
jgi:predicted nucleic acid-binding protein